MVAKSELILERYVLLWPERGYIHVVISLAPNPVPIKLANKSNTLDFEERELLRDQAVAVFNTGIMYEGGDLRVLDFFIKVIPQTHSSNMVES